MADPRARFIISADDRASAALRAVSGQVAGVSSSFRTLGRTLGGLVGAGSFALFTKNALNSADQVQKLSQRLGASTEALSQYRHVAQLTGVDFRTLTTGWQRMTRRIAEAANGTGEARNALKELGLEATSLNRLKPEEQFEVLADAIQNVGSSSDRVRLAMKLFDSEGVALLQTMQGGSEAIRAMREEADRLGLTLDQNTADAAAAANDAMTKLGAATDALGLVLVKSLAPAIAETVNWLQVNLPSGVQVAVNAFYSLQSQILDGVSAWSLALADAQNDLAALAIKAGNPTLARAFLRTARDYLEVGENAKRASVRVGEYVNSEQLRANALQTGITFNELYNASLAKQIPLTKEAAKAQRDAAKSAAKAETERLKAAEQAAKLLQDQRDRALDYIKSIDPFSDTRDQLLEIQELAKVFPDLAEALADVEFDLQAKFDDAGEAGKDAAKEVQDAWKDLGLTFESAFESAIVEGAKLGDVLKSLEQDILRIVTRKLVTEPIGNAVTGLLSGFRLPGFASGGSFEVGSQTSIGTLAGQDNRLIAFAARDGERVTVNRPGQMAGAVVNQYFQFPAADAQTFQRNRAQIARAARAALGGA